MKKLFCFTLLLALCGCTANPTISNPTITQTLTLNSATPSLFVSGKFSDVTTNISTAFPAAGLPPSGLPYVGYFQTGKHDTVQFSVSFGVQCTFSYTLGSAQSSVTTDQNGNYTSSQITF